MTGQLQCLIKVESHTHTLTKSLLKSTFEEEFHWRRSEMRKEEQMLDNAHREQRESSADKIF